MSDEPKRSMPTDEVRDDPAFSAGMLHAVDVLRYLLGSAPDGFSPSAEDLDGIGLGFVHALHEAKAEGNDGSPETAPMADTSGSVDFAYLTMPGREIDLFGACFFSSMRAPEAEQDQERWKLENARDRLHRAIERLAVRTAAGSLERVAAAILARADAHASAAQEADGTVRDEAAKAFVAGLMFARAAVRSEKPAPEPEPAGWKRIPREPTEWLVQDILWQLNRKQAADRIDARLLRDAWAAIVHRSPNPPEPGTRIATPVIVDRTTNDGN